MCHIAGKMFSIKADGGFFPYFFIGEIASFPIILEKS